MLDRLGEGHHYLAVDFNLHIVGNILRIWVQNEHEAGSHWVVAQGETERFDLNQENALIEKWE